MKFALVIVVSMCLAQNTAHGHAIVERATNPIQSAIDNAMDQIGVVASQVGSAIVEGNRLLHEYSDNSTDYAAAFRGVDILAELNATYELYVANLTYKGNISNWNLLHPKIVACYASERNRTESLAANLTKQVVKCVGTKVRQFMDRTIGLEALGNTTNNLVPNTKVKIENCKQQGNDLAKYGCMGVQVATAAAKLAEISVTVSVTVAAGTATFATIQPELAYCAAAKAFTLRQTIIGIPLSIGVCMSHAVSDGL